MSKTPAASRLEPVVSALLGRELPLGLRAWDGSSAGPPDAPATLVVRSRRALRRLLWAPNELGLARAYVSGDLDIEGDVFAVLDLANAGTDRPSLSIDRRTLAGTLLALGAVGPPPAPPAEEIRVRGRLHSPGRDRHAVSSHYDVGNDFYRLLLGESMVYSCAYWPTPTASLAQAQAAKCDLVARKLGLRPGMRLLDVGCGWGSLLMHAAREYGVSGVGVTVSQAQAELARKRIADAGLAHRIEIRLQDYRDVADGPYDAISSIGMAEHVGALRFGEYAARLYSLLRPGGRLLNHQITQPRPVGGSTRTSFLSRYVFPDGELLPLGGVVRALEVAGFEVRDVESLREHYALTLRQWVSNLQESWDAATVASSAGRARVWLLYLAGSALTFEAGRISVHQVLAVKQSSTGLSGMPMTRAGWLTG
ncbi:MAG: cyclopropane-fatty-acyl-phospholipid synthase family protein [Frankiaceae bacterium]